jgi:hypothetical protein
MPAALTLVCLALLASAQLAAAATPRRLPVTTADRSAISAAYTEKYARSLHSFRVSLWLYAGKEYAVATVNRGGVQEVFRRPYGKRGSRFTDLGGACALSRSLRLFFGIRASCSTSAPGAEMGWVPPPWCAATDACALSPPGSAAGLKPENVCESASGDCDPGLCNAAVRQAAVFSALEENADELASNILAAGAPSALAQTAVANALGNIGRKGENAAQRNGAVFCGRANEHLVTDAMNRSSVSISLSVDVPPQIAESNLFPTAAVNAMRDLLEQFARTKIDSERFQCSDDEGSYCNVNVTMSIPAGTVSIDLTSPSH